MKIYVLTENTALNDFFGCEHGLSLYIESQEQTILFDTGHTGLFAENAGKLGLDLAKVDVAVLSHGHYDHGGGIETFLQKNDHAPVYVHRLAFGQYGGRREEGHTDYIGLDQKLLGHPRLRMVEKEMRLNERLMIFSGVEGNICPSPANKALVVKEGDHYRQDIFDHEQNLVITENGRDVLITGCAHSGIINIINRCISLTGRAPAAAIGGFHLCMYEGAGDPVLAGEMARRLLAWPTKYYTGHCTGLAGFELLKGCMGPAVSRLTSGMVFEL